MVLDSVDGDYDLGVERSPENRCIMKLTWRRGS